TGSGKIMCLPRCSTPGSWSILNCTNSHRNRPVSGPYYKTWGRPAVITGSCHCQEVTFQIQQNALTVRYCYCTTCRKLSGADYSAVARVTRDSFRITEGEDSLTVYESRPGKLRYSCCKCFSPIYVTTDNELSFLRVRLGL